MPVFFISLIYAFLTGFFAILTGRAVEKQNYSDAAIWGFTGLSIIINGALHMHRVFIGAA